MSSTRTALLAELRSLSARQATIVAKLAEIEETPNLALPAVEEDQVSTAVAARIADRSPDTIIRWCRCYGIGRLSGGRWTVSRRALVDVVAGRVPG